MKFSGSIRIRKPIDEVVKYFSDPQYLGEHQDGFLRKEMESGNMGEDGAVAKMYYKHGKHEMELTETVVKNNLPESFEAFYHHVHMDNTMIYTFKAISDNETEYKYEGAYIRVSWLMPKLMTILFPGMFRKPALKWMQNFKVFVERQ